jgi:hypothetical protein
MSNVDPPDPGSQSSRKRGAADCLSYSDEEAECAFVPFTQEVVVVPKKAKMKKQKAKVARKAVCKKMDTRGFSKKFKASQSLLTEKRAKKAEKQTKKGLPPKKLGKRKGEYFDFVFLICCLERIGVLVFCTHLLFRCFVDPFEYEDSDDGFPEGQAAGSSSEVAGVVDSSPR